MFNDCHCGFPQFQRRCQKLSPSPFHILIFILNKTEYASLYNVALKPYIIMHYESTAIMLSRIILQSSVLTYCDANIMLLLLLSADTSLLTGRGKARTTVVRVAALGLVPHSQQVCFQYTQTTRESSETPCEIDSQPHDI